MVEARQREARRLWDDLGRVDAWVARTAGLRRLRPETRRTHRNVLSQRDDLAAELAATQERLRSDRRLADRAAAGVDEHSRWVAANQWRHHDIARIDQQLADHWTGVVLEAVHQDDPLAYGLERLRTASHVLAAREGPDAERDLRVVEHALGRERVTRIRAMEAGQPAPAHLTERLGPVPEGAAQRDVWCGLALHLERRLDAGHPITQGHNRGDIAERLDRIGRWDPLDHAPAVIAAAPQSRSDSLPDERPDAQRWLDAAARAADTHRQLERHRSRELDHGLSLSL
jgi:hypothetical protein